MVFPIRRGASSQMDRNRQSRGILSCFFFLLLVEPAGSAVVEIPGEGSSQSGVGVVSGWKCPPNGDITISFDGGPALQAAARVPRGDTSGVCGNDGRNGYVIQYNYNLLGDGPHTVVVRQNGAQFARATFRVATMGQSFLRNQRGTYELPIFANRRLTIAWSEASQNFVIVDTAAPEYLPYAGLLSQISGVGPLYATGSPLVSPVALDEASRMLEVMLTHRRDILDRLQAAGALIAVFAPSERVCDLPYFSSLSGPVCENSAGGLGGTPARPATACSERNVLAYPDDPYGRGLVRGENVCVHELAHTIMNVGLSDGDRQRVRARFDRLKPTRRWQGDFAMENADEFFAEMTQIYFCANPEIPTPLHTHGVNCALELKGFDPVTFQLLEDIYLRPADLS
jgi:hypothetical protein